jgi:RNA polymerase sigma-70 factor (ECF subfamily)
MSETPVSLLERLRQRPDAESWNRLVALYRPLLEGWLRRQGVQPADADDLIQEVLTVVVRELAQFRHGRPGAFRAWLRTILVNRLRGFFRARQSRPQATGDSDVLKLLEQLADPDSDLSRRWDEEHDSYVARQLLAALEPAFTAATWQAFRRQVLEDARAATVAAELGISVNAALLAKSRVLRRLRQEACGLLE